MTWADGSIKAAQMVTIADGSASTYNLRYGPGASRSSPSGLTVTDAASYIEINTGVISFRVNKTAGYLFAQVVNGTTQLLTNSDIIMNNWSDGQDYKSSLETSHTLTVEESGPIRAVLLHTGSLKNAAGTALIKYRARYYAYRGLDHIKLDLRVIDDRTEQNRGIDAAYLANGNPQNMAFVANSYYITMPYFLTGTKTYHFGGNAATPTGTVSGEHYLHQYGNDNVVNGTVGPHDFHLRGVQTSDSSTAAPTAGKMEGWLNVYNGTHSIYAGIREAWQSYPKEVQVDNSTNSMRVSLHPLRATQVGVVADPSNNRFERPRHFYFPRRGGACTNQVLFQFRAGAQQGSNLIAAFNAQPRMVRPASEMCESKVFGDILEAGINSAGYDDHIFQIHTRNYINHTNLGNLNRCYGWRDKGCAYSASTSGANTNHYNRAWKGYLNDTHIGTGMQLGIQWVRTRLETYYKYMEERARHYGDFDMSHCNRLGGSNISPPNIGAGEPHNAGHNENQDDHVCGNYVNNHGVASAMPIYYLLSGDYFAYESMTKMGTWMKTYVTQGRYQLPFPYTTYGSNGEESRNWHWAFAILLEFFKATGDITYLQSLAATPAKWFMQWFRQTGYGRHQDGVTVHANNYLAGLGDWLLPGQSGNSGNSGDWNGGSVWMTAHQLASCCDYFEVDKDYNTIASHAGYTRANWMDMLMQVAQNIFRHHYRRVTSNGSEVWLYDEGNSLVTTEYGRTGRVGDRSAPSTFTYCGGIVSGMPYAFAYIYKLYTNGDSIAGMHPNLGWFTKATSNPGWSTWINCAFNELKIVLPWGGANESRRIIDAGSTAAPTWYGYEPNYHIGEFFKIMAGPSVPPPTLPTLSFTASDNTTSPGENVTLSWSTTNASTVTATGGGGGSIPGPVLIIGASHVYGSNGNNQTGINGYWVGRLPAGSTINAVSGYTIEQMNDNYVQPLTTVPATVVMLLGHNNNTNGSSVPDTAGGTSEMNFMIDALRARGAQRILCITCTSLDAASAIPYDFYDDWFASWNSRQRANALVKGYEIIDYELAFKGVGSYFIGDGIHHTAAGMQAYVDLVVAALNIAPASWAGTKALSGSQVVAPTVTTSYTLTASNAAGSVNDTEIITVGSAQPTPFYQTTFENLDVWRIEKGWHDGFGGNELHYATDRISPTANHNIVYGGGQGLRIVGRQETYTGLNYGTSGASVTRPYTAARLFTRDEIAPGTTKKVEINTGTVYFRALVPAGIDSRGLGPGLWMRGDGGGRTPNYGDTPGCGEWGWEVTAPPSHYGNLGVVNGYSIYTGNEGLTPITIPSGGLVTSFHDYWIAKDIVGGVGRIRYWIDPAPGASPLRTFTMSAAETAIFNRPYYPVICLAIGGRWWTSPTVNTPFPCTMQVTAFKIWDIVVTP